MTRPVSVSFLLCTAFMLARITNAFLPLRSCRAPAIKKVVYKLSCSDNSSIRLFSSSSDQFPASLQQIATEKRRKLLSESLKELHIDAEELHSAAVDSIQDPTQGYDGRYGKSAVKTYRSFLYPKKSAANESEIHETAAAARCARQIDHLLKRHKSHQAEFVRHHDSQDAARSTFR
jgi:hypothetical protein